MVIIGMIRNIRGMVKGVIKGMIISFAVVLVLHTLFMASNQKSTDLPGSVLAVAGLQSSANALMFWFLFTGILAFAWSQVQSRGLRSTLGRFATMPKWIYTAVRTTGSTAIPLTMAGVTIALIVRLYLLNTLTGIQFLILMFGILYSQQESIAVLAMRLGYSDLNRIVKKTGPQIPAPGFPVMGVFGAFAGFLFVVFYADTILVIAISVALMIAGSAFVWYRKKKVQPATAGVSGRGA